MAGVGSVRVPIEVYASKELIAAIEALRVPHLVVDDCWYSCPKAQRDWSEGSASCNDDAKASGDCTCNADEHNAKVDAVIEAVRRVVEP